MKIERSAKDKASTFASKSRVLIRTNTLPNNYAGHYEIGPSAFIQRAGQFYKAVHCKLTRQLKKLQHTDDSSPKQNMYRYILMLFGGRYFNALNVPFHSKSFIQKCTSITLWKNNVYHSLSKSYFSALL